MRHCNIYKTHKESLKNHKYKKVRQVRTHKIIVVFQILNISELYLIVSISSCFVKVSKFTIRCFIFLNVYDLLYSESVEFWNNLLYFGIQYNFCESKF